jgi:hypothetical protein
MRNFIQTKTKAKSKLKNKKADKEFENQNPGLTKFTLTKEEV